MPTFVEQFARPGRRRLVVLAAHPDDESIGATMVFERADPWVLFLTDGAPQDEKLRSGSGPVDREAYARLRREEAVRALAQVGVAPHRIRSLGATDQEAALHLASLTRACADFL